MKNEMRKYFRRVLAMIVVLTICFSSIHILNTVALSESELSNKCETLIDITGKEGGFGETSTALRTSTNVSLPTTMNLSSSDLFEFDVYIEDIDALNTAFEYSLKIEFNFSSNKRLALANANRASVDISDQLVSKGWNHIEVSRSSFVEENIDWDNVRHYYLGIADESGTLLNDLRNKTVKIKNLCESYAIPELTDGDVILFDGAVFGTLGKSASEPLSYIAKTFKTDTSVEDISKQKVLKLDLCIPDYDGFNTFVDEKVFKFVLSSKSGEAEYVFDGVYFPTTVSNWYTIQLPLSDFVVDDNFDFTKVTNFRIEIESDTETTVGSIYNMTFAFANVRGVEIPMLEGDIIYGNEVANYNVFKKVVTFGKTFGDFTTSIDSNFPALAEAEKIEFDLYVNSLEGFRNYFAFDKENNPIDASLDLVLSQASKTIKWSGIEDLILDKGWNHIILAVEDAQINGFNIKKNFENLKLEISGVDKNVENANFGEYVIINNIVSTKGTANIGELTFDKLALVDDGISQKLGNTFAPISQKLDTSVDITNAKMLEFDIYIQNFDAFKILMGQKGISNISLRLSSADGSDYSQDSITAEILEKISNNGWNHLSVYINEFYNAAVGNFDASKVNAWELVFTGNSATTTDILSEQIISVRNVTATDILDPEIPENANPIISEEGKSGTYGETYDKVEANSLISLSEPVDITKYGDVQFDFFVPDYTAFKKLLSGTSNKLRFGLGTTNDNTNGRVLYEFANQVIGQGWNRIKLDRYDYEKYGNDGNPDFKTVYHAFLTFGNDSAANEYKNLEFKIKNICSVPSEYDIAPELPENYVVDIWKDGMCNTWGVNYGDAKMIFRTNMPDNPVDVSDIDFIEFDIYIKDYNSFIEAAETGSLRFVLSSNSSDMNQNILVYKFAEQVTHDGWNHIEIKQSSYIYNWNADLTSIKWAYITMWGGTVQNSPNPLSNTVLRIVNVVGTHGEHRMSPALPDDVVSVLGDENGPFFEGNTVGQQYHFTLDRIYKQRFSPIDFSKTNKIEFDVYIDDYEKFLAAENDPDDYRNSKLAFEVSSTPPALWDQYSAPRHYFSSAVDIAPYITHSGWNHIVVGKQDFTPVNNGGVDWSAITAFLVFYRGSSNVYPVNNPYSDLYVRVGNIVNTGIVSDVPTDKDQPLQKDKSAVYINSAEGMVDENSAWNTIDGYITTDYKTEGSASIHQAINYTQTIDDTTMALIFDSKVDMSDIKTLKFDYFIDIPQFLNKNSNTIQVILGNDRFINDNYYYWEFSTDDLKSGWNEISLDINDAKSVGKPNLNSIKTVTLRFTELSLDVDNYAVVVNGIDNLRYISSTGNTTLRVEGWDDEENDQDVPEEETNDAPQINDVPEINLDSNIENTDIENTDIENTDIDNPEKIETIVDKTGDVKYNNILEKRMITNYTPIIILLAIEALVIVLGLTVFTIISEKKRKK